MLLSVTALMHGDRDPSIAGMVLDSPFSDLRCLCEQMVDKARDQGINVPGFVSSVAIRMIRGSVQKQAHFDIKDVSPISHVPHCFIPALFVAAENDDFIVKSHSLALHDAYAGDANMIVVDGDHNSNRPRFMFDSVSIFLQACLQIPPEWQFQLHPSMNIMAPPWRYPGAQNKRGAGSPPAAMRLTRQEDMQHITSPTRQANIDADSDIDLEEEAAAAIAAGLDDIANDNNGAAIDVETLGMTSERQKEIQGSLFKMLGAEVKQPPQSTGDQKVAAVDGKTATNGEAANAKPDEPDILVNSSGSL